MIRNLLATTAIATLLATGAYAQSTTETPPAAGAEPAAPLEDGAAPADSTAQDSTAEPAEDTAQDDTEEPAEDTAQDDTMEEPADDTAQDDTMEPADDTAQDDTIDTDMETAESDNPEVEGQLASNLIGAAVYNGANDDAENIGEVNDVVIGKDGMAKFVVIAVGGFLGIGEKDVALEYATLEWAERDGDMWLVVETTQEQLEAQPAFDRTAYDPEAMAAMEQQAATDTTTTVPPAGSTMTQTDTAATAPATTGEAVETDDETVVTTVPDEGAADDTVAADSAEVEEDRQVTETAEAPAAGTTTTDTAQAPADDAATDATQTGAIDRSTLQEVDIGAISAEDFVGTTVYGADEENVGDIGDVILSEDGQVDAVIIDVGGFLGMGEKEIAVGMDNLAFMQDADGNRYLYTEWTQEQLEAQPAYDEASYAENRDTMRMTTE